MANHIVKITLNDEEETFIKWLAKYDGIDVLDEYSELKQILSDADKDMERYYDYADSIDELLEDLEIED